MRKDISKEKVNLKGVNYQVNELVVKLVDDMIGGDIGCLMI